jgi:hypothetical protein
MSEQLGLFDARTQGSWIEHVWRAMTPEIRDEVITTLAEMGRAAAASSETRTTRPEEETNDERR